MTDAQRASAEDLLGAIGAPRLLLFIAGYIEDQGRFWKTGSQFHDTNDAIAMLRILTGQINRIDQSWIVKITDKTPIDEVGQRIHDARREWRTDEGIASNTSELTQAYMDRLVCQYGWGADEARYSERSEAIYNHIEGIEEGIIDAQRALDDARMMGYPDRYGN